MAGTIFRGFAPKTGKFFLWGFNFANPTGTHTVDCRSEDLLKVVEGAGQAIVVNSSSAAEARGSLQQLSQIFSSSVVRAEEFNSVAEGMIPILKAVANNLDRAGGSVGELRKLVIAGKVSSEEFYEALRAGLPELAEQYARTTSTIGQAFINLDNALTGFVGSFNETTQTAQGFIDAIGGVTQAIEDTDPRAVANNFAYLDDILKVVAVTFAARLLPRIGQFGASKTRATAVELGFRRSVLTSNEALIRQQILLKSGRAAAARYVRGVRAATVASRAFATSLAFIGGPTGIAVLAGYALYELVSANNAVDDSLDGLPEDVDAFRIAVEKLTAAQRQNLAFKLADDAYEATKAFEEALAAAEKLEAIANNPPARVRGPASSNDALVANRNRQAIEARSAADSAAEGLRVANERLGIASGDTADKETEAVEKVAEASRAYTRVLQSLRTEKEKVNDVYRNAIAVINAEKAASAEEQEEARRRAGERRDQALAEIDERQQADALARERRFADQKLDAQRAAWEQELLAAMGFQTRIEQQAFAHKQRLLDAEFQHAPAVGNILKQAADFEQAEGTKKVQIGLSLAEEGFANAARFNKKFFELQKAAGIANAIVSTAQGVAKALEYPFPANLAFAALVAAAGAVQIATIRAQPPPQQFALGGIVTGRTEFTTGAGRAVAGEYGSPEGILPLQARAKRAARCSGGRRGGRTRGYGDREQCGKCRSWRGRGNWRGACGCFG